MNWCRQHRGVDSEASTRHIARLPAIVLKITVLNKSPHHDKPVEIRFLS